MTRLRRYTTPCTVSLTWFRIPPRSTDTGLRPSISPTLKRTNCNGFLSINSSKLCRRQVELDNAASRCTGWHSLALQAHTPGSQQLHRFLFAFSPPLVIRLVHSRRDTVRLHVRQLRMVTFVSANTRTESTTDTLSLANEWQLRERQHRTASSTNRQSTVSRNVQMTWHVLATQLSV